MRRLELSVTREQAGTKVDTLLKKHLNLSGTVVRRIKWLEDGILVDGKRVKRGMVYRSAYLNSASDEAKDYMVNTLGIKVELDRNALAMAER